MYFQFTYVCKKCEFEWTTTGCSAEDIYCKQCGSTGHISEQKEVLTCDCKDKFNSMYKDFNLWYSNS